MLMRRVRYWLGSAKREAALRAEMEAHLEELAAELRDGGLSDESARLEARRRFGNVGLVQESAREIWIARYWSELWQDVQYGARGLGRNPGFAAVAVLSAGLGIGACSTVFSIVNFAIFRPLAVAEPDRLMTISALKKGVAGGSLSYPEARDIADGMRSTQGVAAFSPFLPAGIHLGGAARRRWGFLVTGNYFDVVRPAFVAGRGFVRGEDDRPGAPAKIVLAHALWVGEFGADPAIVGRTIHVNKRAMTVVGVTGPGFRGTEVGIFADFFLPFSQLSEMELGGSRPGDDRLTSYGSQWLTGLGRLRPGAAVAQARAELATLSVGIRASSSEVASDRTFDIERAGQLLPFLRRLAIPAFWLLLTVAFLVLMTACANVANLLLARASARSQEIATRLALGAGRGRLIRQLLTESLLLALAGGILGVALAEGAGRYIAASRLPLPVPIDLGLPVDHRVILFATAVSVVTALAFGLVPAVRATRPDLIASIRSDGGKVAGLRRFGLRNALVVAQVAMSAVLVLCSGLFLRSLGAARAIDTGMNARDLVLVQFDPALSRYDEEQAQRLLLGVLQDAESLPGARSASVTNVLPLSVGGNFTQVGATDRGEAGGTERAAVMAVGPQYFETVGIPLLEGAGFPPAPSSEAVAVVNEELARRLYPGQDALGRELVTGGTRARIVGVAANSKYQMMQESGATAILYRPILDAGGMDGAFGGLTLIVRTAQPPAAVGQAIRRQILRRDPELVVNPRGTMESHLEASLFLPRLAASLAGICGGVGLLIASIGIYGVLSYAVERRRREIGIRVALGARTSQVVGMVLRHGAALTLLGVAIGVVAGLAMARAAASLIYGVSSTDPVTFVGVPCVFLTVALLATAIPARRAAQVDPSRTLRLE